MSKPYVYPDGSAQTVDCRICYFRWNGGADHGKYHVFLSYDRSYSEENAPVLPTISMQCVVDNFGNLREVKE